MESQIERISQIECRVRVEVPWSDVSPRLQEKLRDLQRRARLPGFRPGKVPAGIIEKMFGKEARNELARALVDETFPSAVANHQTVALTQPVVEVLSLEPQQAFTYAARFEVPPLIEPKDYTGVPVRRRPAVVEGEKVEAELRKLQESLTELRPLTEAEQATPTAPGDVWTVDLEGTLGELPLSRTDLAIEIGATSGEFVPGLVAALADLPRDAVGKSRKLDFEPPADRVREEFRGKRAILTVGLRDVKHREVPALDDEFARDTGQAESLEELRTKLSEKVRAEDADTAEQEARRRLVESLLDRNPFDPSPSLVAREVAAQVDLTKRQLAQQGMTLADIGQTEARLATQIRPSALFNVKAFLVLDAIGKKEGIIVDEEAVAKELESMAAEGGQNVARLRATMEKNGQLVLLRAQIREERILDFLMGKAEVSEGPDPALDAQIEEAAAKATSGSGDEKPARRKRRKKDASGAESSPEGDAGADGDGDAD
jgi:trigger factor